MQQQDVRVSVEEFARVLALEIIFEGRGHMDLDESEVSRPGLQLTGFFQEFAFNRVQLVGNAEMRYLLQMDEEERRGRVRTLMGYALPCFIFSRKHRPPEWFIEEARRSDVPIFGSGRMTSKISHATMNYIDRLRAPSITRHGVLLDIYGVGVMLSGESGTGKSETALELVKRGHRLVADDVLEIRRVAENRLSGSAPALTRHLLEIRGIGIIDVRYMYGVSAVIAEKTIDLIIEMEMWVDGKNYDRLGLDENTVPLLDVAVPHILIPVRPGRNLAIIAEVAARNYRLKKMGYNAAKEFDRRWAEEMQQRY